MQIEHAESRAPSAPTVPHASYCGGSDVSAILGLDPHKTALSVFCEKRELLANETSDEMLAGNDHESGVIAGYTRRVVERLKIVERVIYPGPGTLLSPKDPRRGASPDALAIHLMRGTIVAEAKFVGHGMASRWGDPADGPEGIPENVLVQVTWTSHHLREARGVRAEVAHVAADLGTDRRFYEVPIDDTLIADLLDAFADFWRRHIEGGETPLVVGQDRETLARLYPRASDLLLEDTPQEIVALAAQYDKARAAAKLVELEQERVAALIQAALGERQGFKGPWGKCAWLNATRGKTDWQAIANELGASAELIAKHTQVTSGRRLDVRLKKSGKE